MKKLMKIFVLMSMCACVLILPSCSEGSDQAVGTTHTQELIDTIEVVVAQPDTPILVKRNIASGALLSTKNASDITILYINGCKYYNMQGYRRESLAHADAICTNPKHAEQIKQAVKEALEEYGVARTVLRIK